MSIFSSNLNILQVWNSCLGVVPIFEYCHLNLFCNAGQSLSNEANDSYHSLASPISVTQKHLTFSPSGKLCASIQSLVQGDGIPHPLLAYLRIQVSYPSNFDKLSREQALSYQQGPVALEVVVVVVELAHFDQPAWDLELVLLESEQGFDLQGPEPDFEPWDPEPDLWDLVP